VHAAACDALIFKDDRYRTDVAAAAKVYRRYRGRRPWLAVSITLEGTARDTNDTNAARPRYIADTGSR